MRISYRVALVGGIPMGIAAAIAIAAWFLLAGAERVRDGAVLAGTVYRDLLIAMAARDDYVDASASERALHGERFQEFAEKARAGLGSLTDVARAQHRADVSATSDALARYVERMRQFKEVTAGIDALTAEMAGRAAALIELTDRARERQHASNADIVASLTEGDRKLRFARDVVDRGHELRAAIAAVSLQEAALYAASDPAARASLETQLTFGLSRLRNAAADLGSMLRAGDLGRAADELTRLVAASEARVAALREAGREGGPAPEARRISARAGEDLVQWADRVLKVNSTEHRALHDEVAQLLTYSAQANEAEQATQNIAIAVLKLGRRAEEAFATRNPALTTQIFADSRNLAETVASLPISPLIQGEVIDTILGWRGGLAKTTIGLDQQKRMIADMNDAARTMIDGARSLNDRFAEDADKIGDTLRNMLAIGATAGLLLGSGTALWAARSITGPLARLQGRMLEMAADPLAAPVTEAKRRDELGDMARAANYFVSEIGRREEALRRAKNRADAALAELRKTQADLIQSEKLASLGQLVAGVAHEINTPLGIALTGATLLGDEVARLQAQAATGRMPKAEFTRFVERTTETSGLLHHHLTRAADLVHSFKQVAADQASGEHRAFDMKAWLQDLVVSLGPLLRKAGHQVEVECRDNLVVDTSPGVLAQILTNLVMNAVVHAYDEDRAGRMRLRVSEPQAGTLRVLFEDDGRGIAEADQAKVFDPFFTTGRSRGSTGLGLHIVYNLVTGTLGGRIELDSRPGQGTRFTIEFPVGAVALKASAAA